METKYLCQRILLTNDDGIDAPGMAVLQRVAAQLAPEVWVVAPEHDQSGTAQSISLHQPLRVARRSERAFAITGTPSDCVALACSHLMKDTPPDLLLSGINRGANIGNETVFSGTVGAAMTGILCGIPAIALSQAFHDRTHIPWYIAEQAAPEVLSTLIPRYQYTDYCLNVNFPDVQPADLQPLTVTTQGYGTLRGIHATVHHDPRTLPYFWLSLERTPREEPEESEASALKRGAISVTPLQYNRTDNAARQTLRNIITS